MSDASKAIELDPSLSKAYFRKGFVISDHLFAPLLSRKYIRRLHAAMVILAVRRI